MPKVVFLTNRTQRFFAIRSNRCPNGGNPVVHKIFNEMVCCPVALRDRLYCDPFTCQTVD